LEEDEALEPTAVTEEELELATFATEEELDVTAAGAEEELDVTAAGAEEELDMTAAGAEEELEDATSSEAPMVPDDCVGAVAIPPPVTFPVSAAPDEFENDSSSETPAWLAPGVTELFVDVFVELVTELLPGVVTGLVVGLVTEVVTGALVWVVPLAPLELPPPPPPPPQAAVSIGAMNTIIAVVVRNRRCQLRCTFN